jgi:hypothetical protein
VRIPPSFGIRVETTARKGLSIWGYLGKNAAARALDWYFRGILAAEKLPFGPFWMDKVKQNGSSMPLLVFLRHNRPPSFIPP